MTVPAVSCTVSLGFISDVLSVLSQCFVFDLDLGCPEESQDRRLGLSVKSRYICCPVISINPKMCLDSGSEFAFGNILKYYRL